MIWRLQRLLPTRRRETGITTAGAEANLRAALAAPAAPGEDESYRRLMGVIAEDLRLRQPAPPARAPWSWMPVASVSAAGAILIALAYTAGVDRGVRIASNAEEPRVEIVEPAPEPVVPHGQYVPPAVKPAPPAARPPAAAPKPAPQPAAPEDAPMNYIGSITLEGLTRDQRDLLAIYVRYAEDGEWASAARTLERLANTDPASDMAVTALQGAAEIYRGRLRDDASALEMYQRERDALQGQLTAPADTERKAELRSRLDQANASIAELESATD